MDYQILQLQKPPKDDKGDSLKPVRTAAQPHPAARALSLVGAAVLAIILIGSPASAQVPNVGDPVGEVVGGVSGGGSSGSGSSSGDGGSVGETVGEVGGSVGGTVGEVGGSVGDTVKDTGGSTGDAVSGPGGDAIKDVTGTVGDTVKDTSGSVGGTVKDTSGSAGQSIDGATDSILGDGTKGDREHGSTKDGKKDRTGAGKGKDQKQSGQVGAQGDSVFGEGAFGFGTRVPAITLGSAGSQELAGGQVAAFAPEPLNLGALTEAAVEAVKKFAFPILLSFLVAAFMLIQDRVDRKDPKLALAAVDTDQEWLSFA